MRGDWGHKKMEGNREYELVRNMIKKGIVQL